MSNPRIQLRHDTASNWSTANPVLLDGEIGIEKTDTYPNIVFEFPNVATISNGIMTMSTKPDNLTNDQLNYAIHTKEPIPLGRSSSPLFNCKFRLKPTNNTNEYATIFRQYLAQSDSGYHWDMSFHFSYSRSSLYFSYNNWSSDVSCQLPNDYLNKYYTYRVYVDQDNAPPVIEIIDDNDNIVSSARGQTQLTPQEPSSLEGKYTVIGASYDNWFVGEIDLTKTSMTFKNGTWTWQPSHTVTNAKLKIGDGETAWNDLPYII